MPSKIVVVMVMFFWLHVLEETDIVSMAKSDAQTVLFSKGCETTTTDITLFLEHHNKIFMETLKNISRPSTDNTFGQLRYEGELISLTKTEYNAHTDRLVTEWCRCRSAPYFLVVIVLIGADFMLNILLTVMAVTLFFLFFSHHDLASA